MIGEEEKKMLLNMVNEYQLPSDDLFVKTNKGKHSIGIIKNAKNEENNEIEKLYKYNHFLISIKDLLRKIKLSICYAITFCEKVDPKEFNMFNNNLNNDEFVCYYYLEDTLYRIEMLWDALAQVYNIYSDKNIHPKDIYCNRFFKGLYNEKKYKDLFNLEDIYNYLFEEQSENTDIDIGVHNYINNLRNVSTHRYSLSVTAISSNSDIGLHLRVPEPYLLYKICYDFNKAMKFISEILKKVIDENQGIVKKYSEMLSNMYI